MYMFFTSVVESLQRNKICRCLVGVLRIDQQRRQFFIQSLTKYSYGELFKFYENFKDLPIEQFQLPSAEIFVIILSLV